jgi:hypothetical protein
MAIVDAGRRDSRAVVPLAAALLAITVSACGGETASSVQETGVAEAGDSDVSRSPDVSVLDVTVVDAVADATDVAVADVLGDGGGLVDATLDAPEDSSAAEASPIDSGFESGLDATIDVVVDAPTESCPLGEVVCPPGGCTDLQTDVNNCGSCGNVCPSGASCQTGTCQCPAGQVVCSGTVCADLQNDSANCGSCGNNCMPDNPNDNPPGGYCQLGVCHEPVLLGPGNRGIAVDTNNVYVGISDYGDAGASILRMPKDGGAFTFLATNQGGMYSLAIDSQNVYWASGTAVASAPLAGGTPTTLATNQDSSQGVAVDANNVYWTTYLGGTVMSVPIGGGNPTTLASNWLEATAIAVDATDVYWADYLGATAMVPIGGGSPSAVSGVHGAQSLAVDSTNLYWSGGVVAAVPLGGGSATTLFSCGRQGLALDATTVYFGCGVSSVNKDGTGFVYLSNGLPWAIAVDSTSVYWTDQNIGSVFKIDKP